MPRASVRGTELTMPRDVLNFRCGCASLIQALFLFSRGLRLKATQISHEAVEDDQPNATPGSALSQADGFDRRLKLVGRSRENEFVELAARKTAVRFLRP